MDKNMESLIGSNNNKKAILIVDDEEFNRMILEEYLSSEEYELVHAVDGEDAWEILSQEKTDFSVILLDRNMPKLDGMGLLKRIKKDDRFRNVPVIFQTAIGDVESISEGIKAGSFYYLTKPFSREILLAVVQNAVATYELLSSKEQDLTKECDRVFDILNYAELQFKTLDDARFLAQKLVAFNPEHQSLTLGLTELFINAVEHGNLGISYQEKTALVNDDCWEKEVNTRINLKEHRDKLVRVKINHDKDKLIIKISDEGKGFDWEQYMEISPDRAFDSHGRGIAMSRMLSFDSIEYQGIGNEVIVIKNY